MDLSGLTTYHACVLQARAYRTLRLFMASQLKEYDLTMMEWVLLGLVSSNKDGYSTSELAEILDVGLPLVTNMVDRVADMGLIDRSRDVQDKRLKRITATGKGKVLAGHIEGKVRVNMRNWLSDIDRRSLEGYIGTMQILSNKDPQGVKSD